MNITLVSGSPETIQTGTLVIGVFADGALPPAAKLLDAALGGRLAALVKLGEVGAEAGATLVLHGPAGVAAERLLIVSLGKSQPLSEKAFRDGQTFEGERRESPALARQFADYNALVSDETFADWCNALYRPLLDAPWRSQAQDEARP